MAWTSVRGLAPSVLSKLCNVVKVCARADWDAMSAGTSTATADNAKIFCFISLEPLIFFVARVLAYALRPHVIGKKIP